MKTFLSNIFPRLRKYSRKLDDLALLTNQHWVVLNDVSQIKMVYIFRENGRLIISRNGKAQIGKWEYLGQDSILLDLGEDAYLFRQGFFDENILALKVDSKNEYAILINETKFGRELNSIGAVTQFLEENYLNNPFVNNKYNKYQIGSGLVQEYRITDGFKEGFATVINEDLNYAFINNDRELVTDFIYEYAENFSCGLALVRVDNSFGYIDKSLNFKINPIYINAKSFENGKAKVKIKSSILIIDLNGKEIL